MLILIQSDSPLNSLSVSESGIIDDISTCPEENEPPLAWSMKKMSISSADAVEGSQGKGQQKQRPNKSTTQSPSGSNPYINESITVNL